MKSNFVLSLHLRRCFSFVLLESIKVIITELATIKSISSVRKVE